MFILTQRIYYNPQSSRISFGLSPLHLLLVGVYPNLLQYPAATTDCFLAMPLRLHTSHSVALQFLRPEITITDFDRKLILGAMAPPHKKQKGHFVQELVRRLQAVEIGKHPSATIIFDNKDWIFTFLKDIKPEAGTIGTETEEKELYEAWIKELDDQGASDGE